MKGGSSVKLVLLVKGKSQTVEVDPETPLLFVLADELHLNVPRFGCGMAQCGASASCTFYCGTRACGDSYHSLRRELSVKRVFTALIAGYAAILYAVAQRQVCFNWGALL